MGSGMGPGECKCNQEWVLMSVNVIRNGSLGLQLRSWLGPSLCNVSWLL